MSQPVTNWAGNVSFGAKRFHRPSSLGELQSLVAASSRARALGSGHSFNRIADTTGDLLTVANLPPLIEIDRARSQVRVSAGIRYGQVTGPLDAGGFALPNLGSLPHISIAGACATGTHGSGNANRVLASAASAIELVTADGDVVELSAASSDFAGSVLALGALGVVTALTLDLVPTFVMQQYVYDGFALPVLIEHLHEVFAAAYSVSVFTDWRDDGRNQVWLKHRIDEHGPWTPERRWLDGRLASEPQHPLPGIATDSTTEQLGVPGPWFARLPHFRLEFTPSNGDELQSEYFVPRRHAADAVRAVARLHERIRPLLQISELRSIAADELWLSPSFQRDTVAIHFTWVRDERRVAPVLTEIEQALAPFDVVPHWGKVFTSSPAAVAARYPRLDDFRRLAQGFDPAGKFRNALLDRYLPSF